MWSFYTYNTLYIVFVYYFTVKNLLTFTTPVTGDQVGRCFSWSLKKFAENLVTGFFQTSPKTSTVTWRIIPVSKLLWDNPHENKPFIRHLAHWAWDDPPSKVDRSDFEDPPCGQDIKAIADRTEGFSGTLDINKQNGRFQKVKVFLSGFSSCNSV